MGGYEGPCFLLLFSCLNILGVGPDSRAPWACGNALDSHYGSLKSPLGCNAICLNQYTTNGGSPPPFQPGLDFLGITTLTRPFRDGPDSTYEGLEESYPQFFASTGQIIDLSRPARWLLLLFFCPRRGILSRAARRLVAFLRRGSNV